MLLQSTTGILQSVTILLQSATIITKWNSTQVHTVIRPSEQEKQMTHKNEPINLRRAVTSNPGFLFSCPLANDFNLALRMKVTATVTADHTITQAFNNHRTTRNIFVKKRCEFIIWDGIYPDNYEIVKKGPLALSANSILNMYSLFI